MSPMKTHKKSRAGCKTCKGRRVKCDEEYPICRNCVKREIECIWNNADLQASQSPSIIATSPSNSMPPSPSTPSDHSHEEDKGRLMRSEEIVFDMENLELLHHYTASTCKSICTLDSAIEVFQDLIPELALSNNFLMHALLAIAALHLEMLDPDTSLAKSYKNSATNHYYSCLRTLLSASQLHAYIPVDINAVHMTHSIVAVYVFASTPTLREPSIFSWIDKVRKVNDTLRHVIGGPLQPLLEINLENSPYVPLPYSELPPILFSIFSLDDPSVPDPNELHDTEVRAAYEDAYDKLKQTWFVLMVPAHLKLVPFLFPCSINERFIGLLRERRPRALVLVAYYCAMLEILAEKYWWVGHKGRDDLHIFLEMLEGDTRWDEWLAWPRELVAAIEKQPGAKSVD